MNLRPLHENDLEAVLAMWNRSVRFDRMSPELLEEKIFGDLDYDPELALAAGQEKNLVGMIAGVVRGKGDDVLGFIKLLAVEKNSRRRGIGTKLLQELEQRLARLRVKTIRVFDSAPNYLIPGIDPRDTETLVFFEYHGYERFSETANMEVDLLACNFNTDEEEARLRAQGFEIRRAIMGDKDDLITFLQQHWAAWIPEAERALLNYPISLHLALSHDRVVAFSAYDGNNVNTGWFGPMGTDPSLRGAGLGTVLLKRCLADLQAQNHRLAIIPWVGPYRFYLRHAGATISRVFWRYQKSL